jgi:hypothetical protein
MANKFFWVLVDNNGKKIQENDPLVVVPKEYFENPERVMMFNFFIDITGQDKYSIAVDLRNGMFYIGDWDGFNITIDPEPKITEHNPDIFYRLIYAVRWGIDCAVYNRRKTPDRKILVGFKIGWQVTYQNTNYQRIMFVNADNGKMEIRRKK